MGRWARGSSRYPEAVWVGVRRRPEVVACRGLGEAENRWKKLFLLCCGPSQLSGDSLCLVGQQGQDWRYRTSWSENLTS